MCIYCGTTNYRKIYENHVGPIPKDADGRTYDIHHIDNNHANNDPTNLKAISLQEHYDIHYSQGDYGACYKMGLRMKKSPEEISKLATLTNLKRVADRIHPWQKRPDGTSLATDRVENKTNPFLKREDGSSISSDKVKNGTHHLLDKEAARNRSRIRVKNGTHNLLGGEQQREMNRKLVAEGKHHFLKRPDGTSFAGDMVLQGKHNFLGGEIQRNNMLKRVANGTHHSLRENDPRIQDKTHHFFGGEIQREVNLRSLANGTHSSQFEYTCEHCGRSGKGKGNYVRHHGNNCKFKK